MAGDWPKHLLLVLTNCTDPAREDEFNEWYDHTHLPDLAAQHGVVNAVRYRTRRAADGRPKYLALYELDTDDPRSKIKEILAGDEERTRRGRMIDCLEITFVGTFERMDT